MDPDYVSEESEEEIHPSDWPDYFDRDVEHGEDYEQMVDYYPYDLEPQELEVDYESDYYPDDADYEPDEIYYDDWPTTALAVSQNMEASTIATVGRCDIFFNTKKVLGKGGQGTFVYEGLYNNSIRVAVKTVFKCWAEKQVLPEITALTRCGTHENIVQYLNYKEERERYLLALELCKCSLNEWIKNPDCISSVTLTHRKILMDSASGLKYLHEKRIVHRDLKPGNILISVTGDIATVKLADFGISKFLQDENASMTITSVVGTERWMSPEVLKFIEEKEIIGDPTGEPEKIKMVN